ncbi:hypothetical protein U5640_12085 [Streptomyces sp. SS7]|uniref:hypothetical protein n=1 Tax=Streptomyces sp. SS7 TaxID=3108485 RepID=UPI0030ED9761
MELINHHRILGCGHEPDELFSFQEPGVFTDPENGESCCRRCSDNRHYDRVRRRHAEIEAKAAAEGWAYEYISTSDEVYCRSRELIGKLVCRAYWRDDPHGVDEARGVLQPAHMYNFSFKRLAAVVPNSPVTGYALVFEDGSRDPLCYDKVCVVTREPAGLDR